MKNTLKSLALISAISLSAGSAFASQISGVNGMGNPVVPGATSTITFDGQPNATFSSLSLGGVTFSGIGGVLRTDNSFPNQYNGRGLRYLDNMDSATGFRFDFAAPVSAFAFNWGASNYDWTLRAFDSSNNLIEAFVLPILASSNAGNYVGLANSNMKYATLTLNGSTADWVFVDNFTVAAANVPEPASLALVGLGLLGFAASRRKNKRN